MGNSQRYIFNQLVITICSLLALAIIVSAVEDPAEVVTHLQEKDFHIDYSKSVLNNTNHPSKGIATASLFLGAGEDVGNTSLMHGGSLRRGDIIGRRVKDLSEARRRRARERGRGRGRGRCSVSDGTKCQFSRCGRGQLLPMCAIGFAAGVVGGRGGLSYIVTKSDDNLYNPAPGTLRYGVKIAYSHPGGVWITFARDMTIHLQAQLLVWSHTTLDGRGVKVIITGRSVGMTGVKNVIIHNLQVSGTYGGDTVHIFNSRKVWVDHLTSFDGQYGLVSAVQGSTDVTISNCYLSHNHFNMLLGAEDNDLIDKDMRVTIYRNWFRNSDQRMPHCRWGYCHVMNNLYNNWGSYAIGAKNSARIYSERNAFLPGKNHEVTEWYGPDYDTKWDITPKIISRGDLLLNGATFHEFLHFGDPGAPPYRRPRDYPPLLNTGRLSRLVGHCSGALLGRRIRSCLLYG